MQQKARNPFKPTAGATPPVLIGRQDRLDEFAEAIEDGPGSPGRLSIFTGARGVGKTVMLNAVGEIAENAGWLTVHETATPGLLGRLASQVEAHLQTISTEPNSRLTGVTLPFNLGGIQTAPIPQAAVGLRQRITSLLEVHSIDYDRGLLITIDEVHGAAARDEMREMAALTQHLIREDREIAVVMAGLPSAVEAMLADDVLTFLRRADKHPLHDVDVNEVRRSMVQTITGSGRSIDADAAAVVAAGTGGYPFLIQLVGHHVWRRARDGHIDVEKARAGVDAAVRRLGSLVHEPALADLSPIDRTFLAAMSLDDGPSAMGDIRERMKVIPQYAGQYKNRLIAAGMIHSAGYGKVDFAVPYLREYLREHSASHGFGSRPSDQS